MEIWRAYRSIAESWRNVDYYWQIINCGVEVTMSTKLNEMCKSRANKKLAMKQELVHLYKTSMR